MNCIEHASASEFLQIAEEYLLHAESEHNQVLGHAISLANGEMVSKDSMFLSVLDGAESRGHAIRTTLERPLTISKMDSAAVRCLVEFVFSRNITLKEFMGPVDSSETFAAVWQEKTGTVPHLRMHHGVYELNTVLFPPPDGRDLVSLNAIDRKLAEDYVLGFIADCFPDQKNPQGSSVNIVDAHSETQTLFFWKGKDDVKPVSMAAKARETRHGATIALVYTPPHLRGNGYASRIVAAVSDKYLKAGKEFCNLFTDLMNPTSNSIYQKIGYRKIGESKLFRCIPTS